MFQLRPFFSMRLSTSGAHLGVTFVCLPSWWGLALGRGYSATTLRLCSIICVVLTYLVFCLNGPQRSEEVISSPRTGWFVSHYVGAETKPRSFSKATSAMSHWVILPAPHLDFHSNWRIVWSVDFFLFYLFSFFFSSFLFYPPWFFETVGLLLTPKYWD